jgi:hypothetical protein
MSSEEHLRRHSRAPKSSPVQIIWQDRSGVDKYANGKSLDVSTSGMRVEVTEQIERGVYVTVQAPSLGLHGRASVRSCNRKGLKFILGLEFSGGMEWKRKD